MNKIFFKSIAFVFACLIFAQYAQAQIKLPYNERDSYLSTVYGMTPKQVKDYNKAIQTIDLKWNELKATNCTPKKRYMEEAKIEKELSASLKEILPSSQYQRWISTHKGDLRTRIYTEDLGMTSSQIAKLEKANKQLTKRFKEIRELKISGSEESKLRKEALQQFSDALQSQFNSALANYLIQSSAVIRLAKNLTGDYSIVSEEKAIQYALLKLKYDEDYEKLQQAGLRSKKRKEQSRLLKENYQESLKKILSQEEYIACTKKRDRLNDIKLTNSYQMTDAQIKQYKHLKKKYDIALAKIHNTKAEKAEKRGKRNEAKLKFEAEVRSILAPQQYELWAQDQAVKEKNKKR